MATATHERRVKEPKLTPHQRRRFLCLDTTIRVMEPALRRKEARVLERQRKRLASDVPSAAWYDAADVHGEQFPPGGKETGMIVSIVSGRYTPPHCLEMEDMLDGMSAKKAAYYDHPVSPSARAIIIIREQKARPIGGW